VEDVTLPSRSRKENRDAFRLDGMSRRRMLRAAGSLFLALAAVGLIAIVVSLVLAATAFKAPRGCEECDPYILWSLVIPLMGFVAALVCGVFGLALRLIARGSAVSQ
jgi:hypothetical protein